MVSSCSGFACSSWLLKENWPASLDLRPCQQSPTAVSACEVAPAWWSFDSLAPHRRLRMCAEAECLGQRCCDSGHTCPCHEACGAAKFAERHLLEGSWGPFAEGAAQLQDAWLQGESCMCHADVGCPSSCACDVSWLPGTLSCRVPWRMAGELPAWAGLQGPCSLQRHVGAEWGLCSSSQDPASVYYHIFCSSGGLLVGLGCVPAQGLENCAAGRQCVELQR